MKILTFLLLGLAGSTACAAGANDTLRQRDLLETYAYRATTEMCLIARNSGDKKASERLDKLLADANALSEQVAEQWPAIRQQWQASAAFIKENRAAADSGDVVNVLPNLQIRQDALYKAFDSDRPQEALVDSDERALMTMLDSLERMLASYTMFQTSMFGGHAFTELGIEAQSQRFEQALVSLKDEALREEIGSKWRFVKSALLAYNERAAVFIVDRTGRTIRELLLAHIEQPQLAAE